MRFTNDEFNVVVDELLHQDPRRFDKLCELAERVLRPAVTRWCQMDLTLRGRDYEDDVMQEVHIRLIKTAVTSFFLREDVVGEYNNNPEGFEDWMFTVAHNLVRDQSDKVRRRDFKTTDLDDVPPDALSDQYRYDDGEASLERLRAAFSRVMNYNVGVYKILTWVAQFVFILEYGATKIQSNDMIIRTFEEKTLSDMYRMVLSAAERIPWLAVTDEQRVKIETALRKKHEDGVSYGETKYKVFFMKYKGEVAGKKSISDWMNRMNDKIRSDLSSGDASKKDKKNLRGKKNEEHSDFAGEKEENGENGTSVS